MPVDGDGLASVNNLFLGFYSLQAAWQGNRAFIAASLVGRLVATVVFWQHGSYLGSVVISESVMGGLTAAGLMWDRKRR